MILCIVLKTRRAFTNEIIMGIVWLVAGPEFKYSLNIRINPLLIENSRRSTEGRDKFEKHCTGRRRERNIHIYAITICAGRNLYCCVIYYVTLYISRRSALCIRLLVNRFAQFGMADEEKKRRRKRNTRKRRRDWRNREREWT